METSSEKFVKGETVKFIEDYDVCGTNVNGMKGMFFRVSNNGKCLVYVDDLGEWCEPLPDMIKSVSKGKVSKKNLEFCGRIMTMKTTYGNE